MNRFLLVLLTLSLLAGACSAGGKIFPTPTSQVKGWQPRASMPVPRSEMPAAALDRRIYVPGGFGGETTFEAYDPAEDGWHSLASLPASRHHAMAAAHAGRVYLFGGGRSAINWTPRAEAWSYDPAGDQWSELALMPEPRLAGAAVSLGNFLYIVGGVGGSAALLRYDPAADSWQALSPLVQPREHNAAVALDGKIYALGGRWDGVGELASVEVYDPQTDAWTPGPPLDQPRAGFAAAVLAGRILVAGGELLSGGRRALDSVEVLDPAEGTWRDGPPLPVGLHGFPAAALGENLFVLGGSDRAGGIDNHGRVLSLSSNSLPVVASPQTLPQQPYPTTTDSVESTPAEAQETAASIPTNTPESTPTLTPESPTLEPSSTPTAQASPTADPWVEATLAQMSIEQKVGQMLMIGIVGQEATPELCDSLAQVYPGGMILKRENAPDPHQTRRFLGDLQECIEPATGVPLLIAVDHEGEYLNRFNEGTTTFPAALAQGATGDPEVAQAVTQAGGQELTYSGVNMVLGPVADVLLNLDNDVISQRTFGGDPQQVAAFVAAAVQGYRQDGLIAVLKHFPGHGGVAVDSHEDLPVDSVDRAGLESSYLPPFRSGLAAGAQVVMLAHVAFPQVTGTLSPASLSPEAVQLLRGELGFDGVIMSDALNMKGATGGKIPAEEVAFDAVKAGTDLLLVTTAATVAPTHQRLLAAVRLGEIPLETIDGSVRRILALKAAAGLTGFPVTKAPEPDWEANQQLADEIGHRAVALFNDDAGLLPLSPALQRILVIGPRADWDMYPALKTALEGAGHTVEFADFPPPWEGPVQDPEALDTLPVKAQQADAVILFTWQVHLNRLLNGDTWQIDLVQRLIDTGRPLVVIAIKSPTDLLSLPPVTTYLAMYGSRQGQIQAVIDALTGSFVLTGQNPLPGLNSP